MCSDLSAAQASLLADSFYEIIMMLDSDEAGRDGAAAAAAALSEQTWVRRVTLPTGRQPDQCTIQELHAVLDGI